MTDVFHSEPKPLTTDEEADLRAIKAQAQLLWELYDAASGGREMAVAKTELETSVMWAVKAITGS